MLFDIDDFTALSHAVPRGHEGVTRVLLDRRADTKISGDPERTLLSLAASSGHKAIVEMLLENGMDVGVRDRDGSTALHSATSHRQELVVELLLDRGADVHLTSIDGWTPLHSASKSRNYQPVFLVKILVDRGSGIEDKNREGNSALLLAVWNGNHDVVEFLMEHNADFRASNRTGLTALHAAGSSALVDLFVDKGPDVNDKDCSGRTPLHMAASRGALEVLKRLFEAGADPHAKNSAGETILRSAIIYSSKTATADHISIITEILAQNVDPYCLDIFGRNCFDYASGYDELLSIMKSSNRVDPQPDETARIEWRRNSIRHAVGLLQNILGNETQAQIGKKVWFRQLGCLLALNDDIEESSTAFEQLVIDPSNKIQALQIDVQCASCPMKFPYQINGDLYVCRSCTCMFLCTFCMAKLESTGSIKTRRIEVCKGHLYLKIPSPGWYEIPAEVVNAKGESRSQWLEGLATKYGEEN